MITKKQHYYPRCLMKHFADDQGKVNVYIRQANKIAKMNYEKICASNYSYESHNSIDNILENKLGTYESQMGTIIDNILNNVYPNNLKNLKVTKKQQEFLYQYLWLQYLRTDAGRINFINLYENPFSYQPRKLPINLDEINSNQDKIKKFNAIFKQDEAFEKLLKRKIKPSTMKFHIAISLENLLTSDNPVIGTDDWKQIILPISPYICIEFQEVSINSSDDLVVILERDKTKYLNEATINTANYYVISNHNFDITQNIYMYNRFKNKDWKPGRPHFNLT